MTTLLLTLLLAADPAPPAATSALTPWQAYFRRCAADYRLEVGDNASFAELRKEPVLKWSQPVRGGDDGALFVWLVDGRPAVIGTFFIWPNRDGRFGVSHELHRLTSEALKGDWRQTVRWRPAKDDLAWQPVPGADATSPDKTKRALARMSDLELHPRLDDQELPIGEFTSYDDFASPYLCTAPEFLSEPPAETK